MAKQRSGWQRSWNRDWGIQQRVAENRMALLVVTLLICLFTVAVFPFLYPAAKRGPECTDLAAPLGGNNRSILAQVGNDQQNLDIHIQLVDTSITLGGPLRIDVTFNNNDIGPVILVLKNADTLNPPIISPEVRPTDPGITVEIVNVAGGYNRVDQSLSVLPTGFSEIPDNLHLLGSRSSCTQRIELTGAYLQQRGLNLAGTYRIRVAYRNNNRGAREQIAPGAPTPTATPAYVDQGIWVGNIGSNEELLTVR